MVFKPDYFNFWFDIGSRVHLKLKIYDGNDDRKNEFI